MRKAVAARQFTLCVPAHNTVPPLISLSGHRPIQEANAEALRNLVKSGADLSEKGLRDAGADAGNLGEIDPKGAAPPVRLHRWIVSSSAAKLWRSRWSMPEVSLGDGTVPIRGESHLHILRSALDSCDKQ
jgi:hypothetical protein